MKHYFIFYSQTNYTTNVYLYIYSFSLIIIHFEYNYILKVFEMYDILAITEKNKYKIL